MYDMGIMKKDGKVVYMATLEVLPEGKVMIEVADGTEPFELVCVEFLEQCASMSESLRNWFSEKEIQRMLKFNRGQMDRIRHATVDGYMVDDAAFGVAAKIRIDLHDEMHAAFTRSWARLHQDRFRFQDLEGERSQCLQAIHETRMKALDRFELSGDIRLRFIRHWGPKMSNGSLEGYPEYDEKAHGRPGGLE